MGGRKGGSPILWASPGGTQVSCQQRATMAGWIGGREGLLSVVTLRSHCITNQYGNVNLTRNKLDKHTETSVS